MCLNRTYENTLAAREMFGDGAALFALALVVVEPNMIAHGAYVTTDIGISCFIFASVYAFYRYVKAPSVSRLIVLGLVSGLALASKHSGVLLLPFGLALIFTEILWPSPETRTNKRKVALRLTGAFLAASTIAIVVLWAFYCFRFAARPGGMPLSPSLAEYARGLKGAEPHAYLALARLHILPESYLYGLVDVRLISDSFSTYIFGKVYAHGVWFYFPAAFIIKSMAAFMGLLLLAGFAIVTRKLRARREIFFLTIPPILYLLIATGTGTGSGISVLQCTHWLS
jgi:4-amino-4-deoxy-L-arabinose transferase-like glycosyltransferase